MYIYIYIYMYVLRIFVLYICIPDVKHTHDVFASRCFYAFRRRNWDLALHWPPLHRAIARALQYRIRATTKKNMYSCSNEFELGC